KFAVFHNRKLVEIFTDLSVNELESLISKFDIQKSILSSVSKTAEIFEDVLKNETQYIRFSTGIKSAIKIKYKTPQTLGLDRFAVVIAANAMYPNKNCLVIDAGTCITYDAVDQAGNYTGGSISPGLNMRLKAMHEQTGRLPLVKLDENFTDDEGTDTSSAILSGVVNGTFGEVLAFINTYNSRYSNLQILLCGGDANFFDTRLKSSIFAHTYKTEPHLVLIGLNEVIHQYND
ncbi:MAG: type III pantothenate kinase, partial [Daejeonella sp.]